MGHRDLPPVLRKFGIALTRRVAADWSRTNLDANSSVILSRRKSAKDLARTTSTLPQPGAPPLSAFFADRVGDETLNQQRQSLPHDTSAPPDPTPAVILSGRKSAKDLARTTSTPPAAGCPTLVRVLCGQGGRRNPQPATPVPTAPARHPTQPHPSS